MSDDTTSTAIPLDPDDAFDAVANSRRRRTILSVARAEEVVSASDLAVEIAAIEEGIVPSEVTGEQRTRVYVSLTQRHLSTLAELNALDYDERSKQIKPTDSTEPLAEAVRRVETACYEPTADQEDR